MSAVDRYAYVEKTVDRVGIDDDEGFVDDVCEAKCVQNGKKDQNDFAEFLSPGHRERLQIVVMAYCSMGGGTLARADCARRL